MSQQLINLSPDLKKLQEEGYEIEIYGGHLIVHHIPYVNSKSEINYGKLISTLCLNNNVTIKPDSHVMGFMGEYPCNKDGSIITAIQHSMPNQPISNEIVMNFLFSNKPQDGYNNYYEKITRYSEIISSQAKAIDKSVTDKTFQVIINIDENQNLKYYDTNASRSNITQLNSKFFNQKVGIIGLGGTGSYVLDFISKTPVKEIRLIDGDDFLQHNAFRAPGAVSEDDLSKKMKKVNYFTSIYSNIHNSILPFANYICDDNLDILNELTFVFICIDSNDIKKAIISKLISLGIPFVDLGLGVNLVDNNLIGSIRVTTCTPDKTDHLASRICFDQTVENEYSTNIQIADLNALNAILAVIKWKKLIGFYQDQKQEFNNTYSINTSQLINDDFKI